MIKKTLFYNDNALKITFSERCSSNLYILFLYLTFVDGLKPKSSTNYVNLLETIICLKIYNVLRINE